MQREQQDPGSSPELPLLGSWIAFSIASRAVWFYAGKLLANLTFNYPRWVIHPGNPFAYGWLVAGVGLGAVIYYARRFVGRSVEVAAAFYVAALSPLLGFFMLYTFRYTFVADHYQYSDINLEAAVSDSAEELTYFIFNETALQHVDRDWRPSGMGNRVITSCGKSPSARNGWRRSSKNICRARTKIDFLTIDVEGFDLKDDVMRVLVPFVLLGRNRQTHPRHHFVALQHGLSIPRIKLVDFDPSPGIRAGDFDFAVQSKERRNGVADRRGVHQVARQGRRVPDQRRSEVRQRPAQFRKMRRARAFELRESRARSNAKALRRNLDPL